MWHRPHHPVHIAYEKEAPSKAARLWTSVVYLSVLIPDDILMWFLGIQPCGIETNGFRSKSLCMPTGCVIHKRWKRHINSPRMLQKGDERQTAFRNRLAISLQLSRFPFRESIKCSRQNTGDAQT